MNSKLIVIGALVALGYAQGSIKDKLGQAQAKNLAEQGSFGLLGSELTFADLECDCTPSVPISPASGATANNLYNQAISATQSQVIQEVPNQATQENCESECCSCSEAQEASASTATKTRHFAITGAIDINESVTFSEYTEAQEQAVGESNRVCAGVTTNQQSSGASQQLPPCISF